MMSAPVLTRRAALFHLGAAAGALLASPSVLTAAPGGAPHRGRRRISRESRGYAEGLIRRGYSDEHISLMLGGSFQRVLTEIWG